MDPNVAASHRNADAWRIVLADLDPQTCRSSESCLVSAGHLVCVARSGWQVIELCRLLHPDLLLCALSLPDLDGLAASAEVCRAEPVPVVLVADENTSPPDPLPPHVQDCLVRPVRPLDLLLAVKLARRTFDRLRTLEQKVAELQQALEDRKVIERAKGVLMKHTGLDENEAFRRMTRLATDSNSKLLAVAEDVLKAGDLFRRFELAEGERPERHPGKPIAARPARTPPRSDARSRRARIVFPPEVNDGSPNADGPSEDGQYRMR